MPGVSPRSVKPVNHHNTRMSHGTQTRTQSTRLLVVSPPPGSQPASQTLNCSKAWVGQGSSEQAPPVRPFDMSSYSRSTCPTWGALCPRLFLGFGRLTSYRPMLVPLVVGPSPKPLFSSAPQICMTPFPWPIRWGWGWEWGVSCSLTTCLWPQCPLPQATMWIK